MDTAANSLEMASLTESLLFSVKFHPFKAHIETYSQRRLKQCRFPKTVSISQNGVDFPKRFLCLSYRKCNQHVTRLRLCPPSPPPLQRRQTRLETDTSQNRQSQFRLYRAEP